MISNFSCRFLNPNYFFQFEIYIIDLRNIQEQFKKHSVSKIRMNCSSDLKPSEKFFSITRIFSHICSWNFSFILMHFLTIVAQRCVLMPTAYCFATEFLNPDTLQCKVCTLKLSNKYVINT